MLNKFELGLTPKSIRMAWPGVGYRSPQSVNLLLRLGLEASTTHNDCFLCVYIVLLPKGIYCLELSFTTSVGKFWVEVQSYRIKELKICLSITVWMITSGHFHNSTIISWMLFTLTVKTFRSDAFQKHCLHIQLIADSQFQVRHLTIVCYEWFVMMHTAHH